MFDFIHIATDKMVLAIMKKSVERSSWDIFYKPFHSNAWIMVLITTIVLLLSVKALSYFHQNSHGKNGKIFQKYHRVIWSNLCRNVWLLTLWTSGSTNCVVQWLICQSIY